MNFSIAQKKLYTGVQKVKNAVSKKNTLPIISGILIESTEENNLHLIGTDLEMGIETWVDADIKESGSIVIPATQFFDIIRELPAKTIYFEIDEESYRAKINCGVSQFNIRGFNPEEFPQLPEVNNPVEITIPGSKLYRMVRETEFCTAKDESQPALTGALMVLREDIIRMVSTNTYRLACCEMEINPGVKEKIEVILPGKTLQELKNLLAEKGEAEVYLGSSYAKFRFENVIIISRLIDGTFPNYNQVIPSEYNTTVKVKADELKQAVKRASLIARLDANIISLETEEEKMTVDSINSEQGHAHEKLDIVCEGPEQNINIDAGYLLDILKILDKKELELNLIGPLNPLTICLQDERKYIYLIMPVRPD